MLGYRVMNGTHVEVWLDDSLVGEAYGIQIKEKFDKTDVAFCGQMATDKKVVATSITGSLKMFKVNSRMALALADISSGVDARFTLICKIDDPDAYGSERCSVSNVSFDDITWADYEAQNVAKVEAPFTATKVTMLDRVSV